jgi:hypothetical protein
MLNNINAVKGVAESYENRLATKLTSDANAQIAQDGMEDANYRQMGVNRKKEELNYAKIPSATGASTSSEALRMASQA